MATVDNVYLILQIYAGFDNLKVTKTSSPNERFQMNWDRFSCNRKKDTFDHKKYCKN